MAFAAAVRGCHGACHGTYVLSARPRSLYGKLTFPLWETDLPYLTVLVVFCQLWEFLIPTGYVDSCVLLFSGAMVSLALFLAAFGPSSTRYKNAYECKRMHHTRMQLT